MNDKKLFALGIPTYKRPGLALNLLKQAIDLDLFDEIILSSNSQEPLISEFVSKLCTSKVTFYQQSENVGLSGNYLKILDLCKSKYILFMSDEDTLISTNIQKLKKHLHQLDAGIIYLSVLTLDEKKYKNASKINKTNQFNVLGNGAHIGSIIINKQTISEVSFSALQRYSARKGNVYIGPAIGIAALSDLADIEVFPDSIVKMGKNCEEGEITGYDIYGMKPRFLQFLNLYMLLRELKPRNKTKIIIYLYYYFAHHALHNAFYKFSENPLKSSINILKTERISIFFAIRILILLLLYYVYKVTYFIQSAFSKLNKALISLQSK